MATQLERRTATRRAILDAAVDTLVDRGYAATTTPEVAERAGVSQGAVFKHFPTKAALLGAALEHLLPQLRAGYRAAFVAAGRRRDPVTAAVRLLWETYQQPQLQAALELYVAARTDRELADVLAQVDPPHRAELRAIGREVLPAFASHPDFDTVVELVLDTVQGAAVGTLALGGNDPHRDRMLVHLAAYARRALGES